jgi:leader peptidase (prepilin peptidase) / N-methyltransferase
MDLNILFLAYAGAAMTSFGMLLGYRWKPDSSLSEYLHEVTFRPSRCDHCSRDLSLIATFPIIGWIIFRGRHSCGAKISPKYPIAEALAAIPVVITYQHYGLISAIAILPAIAGIAAAVTSDIKHNEIHEVHSILIALGGVSFSIANDHFIESTLIALTIGILFLVIARSFLNAGRMPFVPFGDLTMLTSLSTFLTISNGPLFFIAIAIFTIALHKPLKRLSLHTTTIDGSFPFAPILALSSFALLLPGI